MGKAKFILSRNKVIEQYNKVKNLCDIVSYSAKTNQHVTKILEEQTDCMFSIHFIRELKHIANKRRVIFLAQAWDYKLIDGLVNLGISWFIVDNIHDLNTLLSYLDKNKDKEVNLLLRVRLKEHTLKTEKYFVFGMGADITNKKLEGLRAIRQINKLGIHFHRKTQNIAEWDLRYEIPQIIEENNWRNIDIVNIGGGLPSRYANTNDNAIGFIFNRIKEFRDFLKKKNTEMMIEPGRFIAAPAVKLITEIVAIYGNTIVVNASVYNSDMDALIVPVKLLVEGELPRGEGKPYMIKGITPCSLDLFRYRVYLKEPRIGEKIIFLNAGAYNFTTDFCDLEKLKTEIVD